MTNTGFTDASRRLGTLLATPIRRTIAAFLAAHRMRRAGAALAALDDRLLADVGLHRAQIWSAVDAAHADAGECDGPHPSRRRVDRLVCRLPS